MNTLQLVEPLINTQAEQNTATPTAQRAAKPTISQLRELIGTHERHQKEAAKFSLFDDGFVTGSVVEIFGYGKTEFIARFLKEHGQLKAAWVEPEITINPYALHQHGANLKNLLFIEAQKEIQWCIGQGLQSGCFQIFIVSGKRFQERELRRFQLLSERGQNYFFLLSERPHESWVPSLQLEITKSGPRLQVATHKKRGFG